MNKLLSKIIGLAAVLILLIFLIAPKLIGSRIEAATIDRLASSLPPELSQQLNINTLSFESAWFSSQAQLEISSDVINEIMPTSLVLQFKIKHGPLLFTADGLKFGLAYAEIAPQINSEAFDQIMTELSNQADIILPAVGFTLSAGFNNDFSISLAIGQISASQALNSGQLQSLTSQLLVNEDLSSEFNLNLQGIDLASKTENFNIHIGNITFASHSKFIAGQLLPSDSKLQIEAINSSAPLSFNIANFSVEHQLSSSAIVANSPQLDFAQQIELGGIKSEFQVEALSLHTDIKGVSADLIERYIEMAANINSLASGTLGNDPVEQLLEDFGIALLQQPLEVDNLFKLNAFGGEHLLQLDIQFSGMADLKSTTQLDMETALKALAFELNIELDQRAILQSPLADLAQTYIEQGFLAAGNDQIKLNATYQQGKLVVNENVLAINQLLNF